MWIWGVPYKGVYALGLDGEMEGGLAGTEESMVEDTYDILATDSYTFDEKNGVLTLTGELKSATMNKIEKDKVKKIVALKGTIFPPVCTSMFEGFENCTEVDLSNADTSDVCIICLQVALH